MPKATKRRSKAVYEHIVRTPRLLAGEPRIRGHRIRVRDIVAARDFAGLTPEEIAANVYPDLTLAQVYAALAYYEDHREEIDRAIAQEEHFLDEFKQKHPELVNDFRK